MFRFIHSADWQLGKSYAEFGSRAEALRQQRLDTLRTALQLARDRAADAFLVAGDLFEDPLVEDSLIEAALGTFADYPDVPVRLLPGNHDPANGPAALWSRRHFQPAALPANVLVFREPGAHPLGPVTLLVSPLRQKHSYTDPSLCLAELSRQLPADRVKIGLTHGSLAIPGQHQPNDFPIHLEAATRAGLDYLGVGHWHNWQTYDGGRLVMPGTPEPDAFGQDHAGFVSCVEIDGPAAPPRVERVQVGTLRWHQWDCDFSAWESHRSQLPLHVQGWEGDAARRVCRVRLNGSASGEERTLAVAFLQDLFGGTFHFEADTTELRATLSAGELAALERDHPLLGQVFADLRQIEFFATNATDEAPAPAAAGPAIPLAEAQALLADAKIPLADLAPADFRAARDLLRDALQLAAVHVCA